jgi:hypothetical protein
MNSDLGVDDAPVITFDPEVPPQQFLERILDDLHSHVGGRLDDDVAMVAVQRAPVPGPAGAGAPEFALSGGARRARVTALPSGINPL